MIHHSLFYFSQYFAMASVTSAKEVIMDKSDLKLFCAVLSLLSIRHRGLFSILSFVFIGVNNFSEQKASRVKYAVQGFPGYCKGMMAANESTEV